MNDLAVENNTLRTVNEHLNREVRALTEETDQLRKNQEALEGLLSNLGKQLQRERLEWEEERLTLRAGVCNLTDSDPNAAAYNLTSNTTPSNEVSGIELVETSTRAPDHSKPSSAPHCEPSNLTQQIRVYLAVKPVEDGSQTVEVTLTVVSDVSSVQHQAPHPTQSAKSAASPPSRAELAASLLAPSSPRGEGGDDVAQAEMITLQLLSDVGCAPNATHAEMTTLKLLADVAPALETPSSPARSSAPVAHQSILAPERPSCGSASSVSSAEAALSSSAGRERGRSVLEPVVKASLPAPARAADIWEDLPRLRQLGLSGGWLVDPSDVDLSGGDSQQPFTRIGRGSTGDVFWGRLRGAEVAVKKVNIRGQSSRQVSSFLRSVEVMARVRCPNVVPFIGASLEPPNGCLILTEYMPGGTLHEWLHARAPAPSFEARLAMALQVAQGMLCLEEMTPTVMHRHLQPRNVLVGPAGEARVSSFSIARFLPAHVPEGGGHAGTLTGEAGDYMYMAPEVIQHQPYTTAADVFSFGIMLGELLSCAAPYSDLPGLTPVQIAFRVVEDCLRPALPEDPAWEPLRPELVALCEACWHSDPSQRPPFCDVVGSLRELQEAAAQPMLPQKSRWSFW